jgi:hypothetical protein
MKMAFDPDKRDPYCGHDPLQALAIIDLFEGEKFFGTIAFYYSDKGRGSFYRPGEKPEITLSYAISRYSEIIGTLRQEKPVFVKMHTDTTVLPWLETGMEKVGEEEGR